MMLTPRIGQRVRIRYRRRLREHMPLHDRVGIVRIVSRGPGPRNHGVEVDGKLYGVPAGHLMKLIVCPRCHGVGYDPPESDNICRRCDGNELVTPSKGDSQ